MLRLECKLWRTLWRKWHLVVSSILRYCNGIVAVRNSEEGRLITTKQLLAQEICIS